MQNSSKTYKIKWVGKGKPSFKLPKEIEGPKTYHEGANDERTAILAKVRRAKKGNSDLSTAKLMLDDLEKWILQRNERYKKNPGGL